MILTIESLLSAQDLANVDKVLARAVWADGALSAAGHARKVKRNAELDAQKTPGARDLEALVYRRLAGHPDVADRALPLKFSRPIISRYDPGMAYGEHVDNPLLGGTGATMRTDISATVFLADPADYDGGELVMTVEGEERTFRMPRGGAVVYGTGVSHRVAPVTRGARVAAVVWMQSIVADPGKREILSEFQRAHHLMVEKHPDSPETALVLKAYYNLMRRWTQV
ncbi:MAG: Fe2+-dependent dioxygenase [Rhodobacterales bacterium]|nr:Fe2+-dependent dioxygenase [Rhodobacterales bacterium]